MGKDLLEGGGGNDLFLCDAPVAKSNLDKLKDFKGGRDTILLAEEHFIGLGPGGVDAAEFDQHFDYSGKGVLKFDGVAFARLLGAPKIDEGDFLVV